MDVGFRVGCFRSFQLDLDRCLERLAGLQKGYACLQAGNRFVVSGPWCRNEHIPKRIHYLRFFVGDQLRQNQQIGAGDQVVQSMNREQVAAFDQNVPRVWDGKFNGRCCCRVGSVLRCAGFPVQRCWGVVAGDFFAVDEGGESILVLQVQCQFIDNRQVRHVERNTDVNRFVVVPHLGDIQLDTVAVIITDTGPSGFPSGVVKVGFFPGCIVRVVHRDNCPGSRTLFDEHHLIPLCVSLAKRDILVLRRICRGEFRDDA